MGIDDNLDASKAGLRADELDVLRPKCVWPKAGETEFSKKRSKPGPFVADNDDKLVATTGGGPPCRGISVVARSLSHWHRGRRDLSGGPNQYNGPYWNLALPACFCGFLVPSIPNCGRRTQSEKRRISVVSHGVTRPDLHQLSTYASDESH